MKEISIFIATHDFAQATQTLQKHNVGGMSFNDKTGTLFHYSHSPN
jgi:hypothetical protein